MRRLPQTGATPSLLRRAGVAARGASDGVGMHNYENTANGTANDMRLEREKSYEGPMRGSDGPTNRPKIYSAPTPQTWFEKEYPNVIDKLPSRSNTSIHEPRERSDNIKQTEFSTSFGRSEIPPHCSGGPGAMRYHDYVRRSANEQGVTLEDVDHKVPFDGHHPDKDYRLLTGKQQGNNTLLLGSTTYMELKSAIYSLYRSCLKATGLVKHFYWLTTPLPEMHKHIYWQFMKNQHVKDPAAIRHLVYNGWMEYHSVVQCRRPRATVDKFFTYDSHDTIQDHYTSEEGQQAHERAFWHGEEQRREGPYNGHWSWLGEQSEKEFAKIAGRIPISFTASRGYFERAQADGTNFWEKNLDYEGWYIKNVDPDAKNARLEMQGWIESGYNQPKHYASKNRRGYRRMVKDLETLMETSMEDMYTHNREQVFQYLIRETSPESNRINAERTLALQDDDFYSTKHEEYERYLKQTMREMPNPRLWKTDAFYFRLRYLLAPLEYNWAKMPVGAEQEKLFNEWISNDVNYAVLHSKCFADIKQDKARNPMAWTWADFYSHFDPDVRESRNLPWYHRDFDYDRRHKWDERCMRMKRWVQSGTIDCKYAYFDSFIAEWEQFVNRPERFRACDSAERRYAAPRMVQLYRALNRLMDVALSEQIRSFANEQTGGALDGAATCREAAFHASQSSMASRGANSPGSAVHSVADLQCIVDGVGFDKFVFRVPVLIFPDHYEQQVLDLDGTAARASQKNAP